ncbi:hypothetical protein PP641_gp084 [Arthrobacter phage SilentRX]|uniref:Uncharacterized protein n=1 Tax=Arthrobacter phage SilentRX TaxID=2836091 RepID=A0A8F3IPQ3_9CAUD|nr:hypothetical protein PP641_gp084 [Arthrobacter phage SilentRX]QWY82824.1 hypothetical protein SEA_SILENTRX_84 [Arthrobacter phage SilentRX]
MSGEEFEEIELHVTVTVRKGLSEAARERLSHALFTYAHTMNNVVEAGIRRIEIPLDRLVMLWNEVEHAAPIVHGMAPADPVWGGMTCTEAEAVAGIFGAAGKPEIEEFILEQHALGDDDPEDEHHEKFLEVMGRAGA